MSRLGDRTIGSSLLQRIQSSIIGTLGSWSVLSDVDGRNQSWQFITFHIVGNLYSDLTCSPRAWLNETKHWTNNASRHTLMLGWELLSILAVQKQSNGLLAQPKTKDQRKFWMGRGVQWTGVHLCKVCKWRMTTIAQFNCIVRVLSVVMIKMGPCSVIHGLYKMVTITWLVTEPVTTIIVIGDPVWSILPLLNRR